MIGRIYKIIHAQSNFIYIGSTTQFLRTRWAEHKYKHTRNQSVLYDQMNKHGIDQFKIMLIKEYEVIDRKHLYAYEQLWINKLSSGNEHAAFQPLDKESRRQALKKSNLKHKLKHNLARKKQYTCDICNKTLVWDHKSRHERTKRHLGNSLL